MENENDDQKAKAPGNENYDVENPQNETVPQYNSTTTKRDGPGVPAVENLNQNNGLKNEPTDPNKADSDPSAPENDESLYGNDTKTDLGNGQHDDNEKERDDERIIRT